MAGETGPEVNPKVELKQVKKEQEVVDSDTAPPVGGGSDLDLNELGSGKGGSGLVGNDELLQKDGTMPPTRPVSGTNTPAPLTIFYGERVFVFEAISFEKAGEIICIAAAAASSGDVKNIGTDGAATKPVLSRSPSLQSTATPLASPQSQMYPVHRPSLCKVQADLPIARRHSLQRFFEKRRDRLVSKNPYPTPVGTKNVESSKPEVCAQASPDAGCFEKSNEPQAA